MSTRTIRIWPLPEHKSQQEIRSALGDVAINRIHIGKSEAYVELQSQDSIQVLEFTCPDNRLEQLDANFEKVGASFKWDSLSSDSSSIQDLKDQREQFEKHEEHITHLTQPSPQNLITISYCNPEIVSNLTQNQIKNQVFEGFSTINRILKKGSKVVIQLQMAQSQLLQAKFPNLKIPALGNQAIIDLQAQNTPNFSMQWIEQQKQEQKTAQGKKIEQEEVKHVLHQQIIPKLNKLTSMQTDFLMSQNQQNPNTQSHFTDITEQSAEHLHTKNQLNEENIGFIMGQQLPSNCEQFFIPNNSYQQEQARRLQQQHQRKLQQQIERLKQQQQRKRHQEERAQKQRIQKQRLEIQRLQRQKQQKLRQQKERLEAEQKQRHARQQKQRIQRQLKEKQQKQQQERQRKQREDKLKKEKEQKQRKQQQQKLIRQQQEKLKKQQQQKLKRQQQQKHKRQQEEKLKRQQDEKLKRQQQEKLRKQAEQRQRKQQEQKRLQKQRMEKIRLAVEKQHHDKLALEQKVRKQRQIQEAERKKRQKQNTQGQFVLEQEIMKQKQNIQNIINNSSSQTINNLIKSQSQSPIAFWAIVMVSILALLLI